MLISSFCKFLLNLQLTVKNIQIARVLIINAQINGQQLGDCWYLVLTTVQHLVWILGMTPNLQEGFRTDGASFYELF